jgi:Flp pilus assembly protein TadG
MRIQRTPRAGTTTAEFAIIALVTLLIVFGILVGSFGIYRYQQVASLARRAARYAAVHGSNYAQKTGQPAATRDEIYNKVILPNAVMLDASRLSVNLAWAPSTKPGSTVTVTVQYSWAAEAIFGSLNLKSAATDMVSY